MREEGNKWSRMRSPWKALIVLYPDGLPRPRVEEHPRSKASTALTDMSAKGGLGAAEQEEVVVKDLPSAFRTHLYQLLGRDRALTRRERR